MYHPPCLVALNLGRRLDDEEREFGGTLHGASRCDLFMLSSWWCKLATGNIMGTLQNLSAPFISVICSAQLKHKGKSGTRMPGVLVLVTEWSENN
jgi:hypothetical protein